MRGVRRRVVKVLRDNDDGIRRTWRQLRHKLFIARVSLLARRELSRVTIELAPDVRIGRNVRVHVWRGTQTTIRLGPHSRIGDNVTFQLKGGEFVGGVQTDLRANAVIQTGGRLVLDGENTVSYGCVLHCAESVHLGYATIMGEYATIADSTHFHTTPDDPVVHNVVTAPVEIGRNVFICPKVSVSRGVTVGAWSVIGPGSVVTKDIPAGVFASGIPAAVVRDLEHPWMRDLAKGDPAAPDPAWPAKVCT